LFLGAVLILILYALPGGIIGFIQEHNVANTDEYATRMRKVVNEFARKFWYFFYAMLFFTAFFSILQAPDSWWTSAEWEFAWGELYTWGIVPRTLVQGVVGLLIIPPLLRGLKAFSPLARFLTLLFPILPLALHIYLRTPLSGIMITALWAVFVYTNLLRVDVRQAFRQPYRTDLRVASGM
jgi:hypothetical protein